MNNTPKVQEIITVNPALQMLAQMHGGATVTELADATAIAVAAVRKTGKKCKITLEILIAPEGKGEVNAVETTATVNCKPPKKDMRPTIFFVGENNELTRDDPNQRELPLEDRAPLSALAGGKK